MGSTSPPYVFPHSDQPAATSPVFYKLSKEETDDMDEAIDGLVTLEQTSAPQSVVVAPKTHDISRIGWHMQDLDSLTKTIEDVGNIE